MPDVAFIYALNDPRTGECRYLGKSTNPKRRFRAHLSTARSPRSHRDFWIASILRTGSHPKLEILDQVDLESWEFWEREYIRLFRAINIRLTNTSEGGDSGPSLPGNKNPMFGVQSPMLGKKHSPEVKEKIRQALRGNKNGTGHRYCVSLKTREKLRASNGGRPWSAARRAAQEKK